jgi:FkbM family methyltransferase
MPANKLFQIRRLNLRLSLKVLLIYMKRILGFRLDESETGYLSYLFTLENCDLRHISEEKNYFETSTSFGVKLFLRKHPSSDSQVLQQIWIDKEYQVIVDMIKDKNHQPEICIVDAGANVGYSSLYLFYHLKDRFKLKFIVVEPSTENLEILKKNFAANGLKDFYIEEAGLYNKTCYLKILKDFRDGRDWSLRIEEADEPTDLRSVELQSLIRKYSWTGIDFCKVDIEGAEQYIFQDKSYANHFLENIKMISIEIHDEMNVRQGILDSLDENNFQHFDHGELTIGYSSKN